MILVNGGDLFQWNLGRSVTYTPENGEVINELHFANPGDVKALIMDAVATDGTYTAEIPNILLQAGKPVCVWAVRKTEAGRHTIEMFVAPVRKQVRPADYVYTQTEIKSYADLDERLKLVEAGGVQAVNAVLYTPQSLTAQQQAQAQKNLGITGSAWRLLAEFDLSGGALSYTADTTGCTELLMLTFETATCSGQSITWKGTNLSDVSHIASGSIRRLEYLGDGVIAVHGPRGNSDTLIKSSISTDAEENNNAFVLSYSEASAGRIELWGRAGVGGGSGNVTDEQVESAVNKYLDENPVSAGATAEQAAQIASNTERIKTLEESDTNTSADTLIVTFAPNWEEVYDPDNEITEEQIVSYTADTDYHDIAAAFADGMVVIAKWSNDGGTVWNVACGGYADQEFPHGKVGPFVYDAGEGADWHYVDESADLPSGGSADEYVTICHTTLAADTTNETEFGGESHLYGSNHFWITDIDGNPLQLDLIRCYIHVPSQTTVTSGEIQLRAGFDTFSDPKAWNSWNEAILGNPYLNFAGFVSSGKESWLHAIMDFRQKKFTESHVAGITPGGSFQNCTIRDAIPFARVCAGASYFKGISIRLISGSLPAGTEIFIYGRKLNTNVASDPAWEVAE